MLENILYILSECSLIAGALILLLGMLWTDLSQRFCFSVTKAAVVLSAFFAVLFYNKSFWEVYFFVSASTTFVFVLTCVFAFVWLSLASKWFAVHKDYAPHKFCFDALMLLLCLKEMSQTQHLGILFAFVCLLFLLQYMLFVFSHQSEELYHVGRRYFGISVLFILLFAAILFVLKEQSWQYDAIGEYLMQASKGIQVFIMSAILCVLLFLQIDV